MNKEGTEMIDVVVPNWNGLAILPSCLEALRAQTFTRFRVMVVDNGSEDGSVEYLREHYPEVRVLALDRNGGFCGAVNGTTAYFAGVPFEQPFFCWGFSFYFYILLGRMGRMGRKAFIDWLFCWANAGRIGANFL